MFRTILPIALLTAGTIFAQNYQAVASNKQIMGAIQKPSMDALAAMNKAGGPKDDKEWEQASWHAAALGETAQLLLLGNRPKDQDIWVKTSNRLLDGAKESVKAAEGKDLNAWKASLGKMGGACRGCHDVHRPKKQAQ